MRAYPINFKKAKYFIIMFTSGASHRGRIDTDLYIETPDFYTHLRKRTILRLAHLLAYVELYEQYNP